MSNRPARPVGEDGKPEFPAAIPGGDDDVHGHSFVVMEPEDAEKAEGDEPKRAPNLAV